MRKTTETGSVDDLRRSGRRRKSTPRQDRVLARLCSAAPSTVSRSLQQNWQAVTNVQVSARTVRRRLVQSGFKTTIAKKKPLLTPRHRQQRLQWAQQHRNWTPEDWANVVWSDEVPVHLVQTTQRRYVRVRQHQRHQAPVYQPRLQGGGGSCMFWGAFHAQGVLRLYRIRGNLTAAGYVEILQNRLQPFLLANRGFVFQQDNARPHSARMTQEWLQENGIDTMQWPPNSPDLNPIENV